MSNRDGGRAWICPVRAGIEHEISLGWMLYHVLERLAGHYHQIKLRRHPYRTAPAPGHVG